MDPALSELLIAIIVCVFLGGALGNYATSFVHRLPAKEPVFERHPFCASCNTYLQPKDLFPLFSYLRSRGKCRYCGASIPSVHFLVEVVTVMITFSAYFTLGLQESFILMVAIGILWLILGMIALRSAYIETLMLSWLFAIVAILRVLVEGSIYPMFFSALVLVMVAGYAHYKRKVPFPKVAIWVLCALAVPWPFAMAILIMSWVLSSIYNKCAKNDLELLPLLSGIGVYTALLLSL